MIITVLSPRNALLVALGVDNFGAGVFLPLTLVYVTQVVGLPLPAAAAAVTAGTIVGLVVPPVAGRLVDRVGPRRVVVAAQVLQAAAAVSYLLAGLLGHGAVGVVVAAALLQAAGQQTFYSALFSLISTVAGDGPKDHSFTIVSMVRSATFGAGSLAAGVLLTVAGPSAFRAAITADAVCLALAAVLLTIGLRHVVHAPAQPGSDLPPSSVLRNRPFLGLILLTFLAVLAVDFFLVGMPVFTLEVMHAPAWVPGTALAVVTVLSATAGTLVLRLTRGLSRPGAMRLAAAVLVVWCVMSASAAAVPSGWVPAYLLLASAVMGLGWLVWGGRGNALAEAAAPPAARGRYLAAYQYAATVAGVAAPALTALFAVAAWLPWLVLACALTCCWAFLPRLAARLPAAAVTG